MSDKLTIYIVGDLKSGAADGLAEFNYRNVKLLKDTFLFEFVEFDNTKSSKYYHIEIREDIAVHRFGTKGLLPFTLPVAFSGWLKGLTTESLFHLSHIWNVRNYLIARSLVRRNTPYLITPHDSYVYGGEYNENRPLIKRLYRAGFVSVFDKYVLDHAQIVHALTDHCVPSLRLITNTPIIVVENQIADTNISLSVSSLKPQVCFIGRFNIVQKGIDLALKAFAAFKEGGGSSGVRFVLVGPSNEQASEAVRSMCEDLKLTIGEDIILTGKVSESERNSMLGESKVYMQLSRYEGFGLSVGQALSSCKPVIISTGIPIGKTIGLHQAGYVVNNAQEAAEALHKIFSMSQPAYLEMALNARRCYEQEFHPEVIKPKLIQLYESAAKG